MNQRRNSLAAVPGAAETAIPFHESFDLIDIACWATAEPPLREWTLTDWLPKRRAAYMTGAGGVGKSLLGQQLATCVALGLPFLGIDTAPGAAIYLTAEDDFDELQRRQRAICQSLNIVESDLDMKLFPISLFGRGDNEMIDFEGDGSHLRELPAWAMLKNTARITFARLIVLDNVSHFFAGSEINRAQVTAFANMLNGLAQTINGTVLLIGHPNKAGDAYSGSTAWENAFRARLYFDAPKAEGAHTDPDTRQLSLPKANYAKRGQPIEVRWHEGVFVCDADLPTSSLAAIREVSAHTAANDAFLRCLDVATDQRRAVSHVPGVNYAPKIFAAMTEGKGTSETAFKGALERLLHLRLIELDKPLWQGQNRHWKQGIRRAEAVAPTPLRQPPAPTRANPLAETAARGRFDCADPAPPPPLYPTDISGGAAWLGPPDSDELDWE